ncbi:MAG: efflux RND transporter periplasmic adaptor subunit [Bacteroidales bacterium]
MKKEKIKTIGLYSGLVLAGLIAGWLLFGRTGDNNDKHIQDEETTQENIEYTCSMHPQVRQDEPGDCPICGMDLIPVADHDDHQEDDPFLFSMQERHASWANVQTQKIEKINTGANINLSGKVAVNEKEKRLITAHFPGRIEKLYANYTGKYIQKGEKLATVYSSEMASAQEELLQASANKDAQPRLYNAARKRLKLFNLTEQQINNIESEREVSSTMDVYSTTSGYLSQRSVSEGDYINIGQELFAITGLNTVWIELDVYENQINHVSSGQRVIVEVPALPEQEFTGEVEFVDPFLDPESRSTIIRLTVSNNRNLLKPEMLVNATIKGTQEARIVIPSTSILWTGKKSIIYVKKEHTDSSITFEFREIEIGNLTDDGYIVLSGLSEGEEIAVNGVFAIDASAQLQGHYSMMNPPEKVHLPETFKQELKSIFNQYFELKNALADDDADKAHKAGNSLKTQLEKTGPHALDGEHHMFWMNQYESIFENLEHFLEQKEMKTMRMHFEHLSADFIEIAKTFGAIDQQYFVAYCPMYDNDRGAYWLSEFEQIKNPYFGSMMLRCGEVREIIRPEVGRVKQDMDREVQGHVH